MVTQNAALSMENAMLDQIPNSANSLIDFAAQIAAKRKEAASDGSTASDKDPSDITLKPVASPSSIVDVISSKEDLEVERKNMERRIKLFDLMKLESDKNRLDGDADGRRRYVEFFEKFIAVSPEPAQSVTGDEAKRVWEMGRQNAREGGHFGFPPPKDSTYILIAEGFQYNIRGDGTITRQKEGVSTPEQYASTMATLKTARAQNVILDAERAKQYSEIDAQMTSLKAELGITDDSWRDELEARKSFSIAV
ncbi:hypothetical protein [Magnetospirillum fulvum]|nr:hypothetical protein [Magnetospirillum fulvum]